MEYRLISELEMFSALSEADAIELSQYVTRREIPSNQIIFRRGQIGEEVMFIVKGRVKISLTSVEGRELLITYLEAGSFFGELAVRYPDRF